mgnify:CR=1 FL=1|jgi:hypothetical protein
MIRDAEEQLFKLSHPDKYIPAYMPGGSLFMRNPPLPLSVCYPDQIYGQSVGLVLNRDQETPPLGGVEYNPDLTVANVETGKVATGRILVDSCNKSMS